MDISNSYCTVFFNKPIEDSFSSLSSVLSRITEAYELYNGDWRMVRECLSVRDDNEALCLMLHYPDFFQKLF